MILEHSFYGVKEHTGAMQLTQAGIFLKCRCGANLVADIAQVRFGDHGRITVGVQPLRCPVCGAVYRLGERLSYRLARPPNGRS
jgi:hypothetical protein